MKDIMYESPSFTLRGLQADGISVKSADVYTEASEKFRKNCDKNGAIG